MMSLQNNCRLVTQHIAREFQNLQFPLKRGLPLNQGIRELKGSAHADPVISNDFFQSSWSTALTMIT
jgi:hypothetical protein